MQNGQESVTGGLLGEPGTQKLPASPAPHLVPAMLQQAVPEKQLWQLAGSQPMPGACILAGLATVRTETWGTVRGARGRPGEGAQEVPGTLRLKQQCRRTFKQVTRFFMLTLFPAQPLWVVSFVTEGLQSELVMEATELKTQFACNLWGTQGVPSAGRGSWL